MGFGINPCISRLPQQALKRSTPGTRILEDLASSSTHALARYDVSDGVAHQGIGGALADDSFAGLRLLLFAGNWKSKDIRWVTLLAFDYELAY